MKRKWDCHGVIALLFEYHLQISEGVMEHIRFLTSLYPGQLIKESNTIIYKYKNRKCNRIG